MDLFLEEAVQLETGNTIGMIAIDGQVVTVDEDEGLLLVYSLKSDLETVDFEKETIIGLFMGEKTTGGYAISVASIEETKNELIVQVAESAPKGKFVSMVITQPFSIFKIKKTDKAIRFEKIEH